MNSQLENQVYAYKERTDLSPKWLSDLVNPPSSIHLKARLELSAEKHQYSLGEQVKGSLKINSDEEFCTKQVSVFLTCNENIKRNKVWTNQYGTYQSEYWDNAVIYRSISKIFDAATIPTGFSGSYPYTLDISFGAKETLYGIDHNVKWQLFALMEPSGRPNIQTPIYEIQVARPMNDDHHEHVVKELTREVVLIPCGYCGGLMPQAAIFCPNCGARRKS